MTTAAAVTAAGLAGAVATFQLALALGAPWGGVAYGGRAARAEWTLPAGLRIASALTVLMLFAVAWAVLAAADLMTSGPLPHQLLPRIC